MLTKHPLQRLSLAPFGLTTALSWRRLHCKPSMGYRVNQERMSARLWEKRNRAGVPGPWPVETIIHDILPGISGRHRTASGDFEFCGKPYCTRDIATLASVVQWLGTSGGQNFMDTPMYRKPKGYTDAKEFTLKLARENRTHNYYAFLVHRCDQRCGGRKGVFNCVFSGRTVTERDRVVVLGLMRWLGSENGRQYLADFRARRDQAWKDANRRRRRQSERRRAA
ncbi:MAG: hypothetical protein JWL87_412 [Candidatus Adlerbacteria bacterium]|nr:hypothetical protein [Candidatus Adlerbacteria bacterium]